LGGALSKKENFEKMRRLPELAAWITQFFYRTGIRKNEEHEKTFFRENTRKFFFQPKKSQQSPTISEKFS